MAVAPCLSLASRKRRYRSCRATVSTDCLRAFTKAGTSTPNVIKGHCRLAASACTKRTSSSAAARR